MVLAMCVRGMQEVMHVPMSRTNWVIWPTVMYFFHQMRMPRALWR
jgi:hypothetical protein